jgi:hypothetical protein
VYDGDFRQNSKNLYHKHPITSQFALVSLTIPDGRDGNDRYYRQQDGSESGADVEHEAYGEDHLEGVASQHADVDRHRILDDLRVGRESVRQLSRPVVVEEPNFLPQYGCKELCVQQRQDQGISKTKQPCLNHLQHCYRRHRLFLQYPQASYARRFHGLVFYYVEIISNKAGLRLG